MLTSLSCLIVIVIECSVQIASTSVQEADIADHSRSPAKMPENLTSSSDHPESPAEIPEHLTSREPDISSSIPTPSEYDQSKTEAASAPDGSQYSVVHTAPTYSNFGLVPPMLGNQFATFEGAEPQARDATHTPSFLVSFIFSVLCISLAKTLVWHPICTFDIYLHRI